MSDIQKVDLMRKDGSERMPVYETGDVQIMRIRLAPGDALPHHHANSNVLLAPVCGEITFAGEDKTVHIKPGEGLSVPYDTPMLVSNTGTEPAVLMVIKTPHPQNYEAE